MLGDGCAHTQQSFWPSLGLEVDVWCLVGPQRAFLHSRHAVSKVRTSSHADLDQTRKGAAVTLELGDADLHESAPPPPDRGPCTLQPCLRPRRPCMARVVVPGGSCSLVLALVSPCPGQPRPHVLCPLKARPQPLEMRMRYWPGWAICTAFQGGH